MPQKYRTGEERRWTICDKGNPDALIHHVWPEFRDRILALDEKYPDLWSFTESRLVKWVEPTQMLRQLRAVFWSHVYRSRTLSMPIREKTLLVGFLDRANFLDLISVDANLAFLLMPPSRVEALFESILYQGLQQMKEVVSEPLANKNGRAKRDHLLNIILTLRECERRLARDQTYLLRERATLRNKMIDELKKDGAVLNERPPDPLPPPEEEADEFDYSDYDLEEGEVHGASRSDSGDKINTITEEGSD